MIISSEFVSRHRLNMPGSEVRNKSLKQFPLAWFGATVNYPKMAQIIRDWCEKKPMVTVVSGWKRTGKTSGAAFIGSCFLYGKIDRHWPGAKDMGIKRTIKWNKMAGGRQVGLMGGKSMEHIYTVMAEMYYDLIPPSWLKEKFNPAKSIKRIEGADNRRMVIRSYDQDLEVWKSGAYKFIHLDEEPPLPVLRECLERMRTVNGRMIITVAIDDADISYLPDACANPERYFGTKSFMHAKLGVEDVPESIYPANQKEMVYKLYDGTPQEKAVRFGEFSYMSGRWWAAFDVNVHVIPHFEIPKDWKRYRAMDAGFRAHAGCVWFAVHPMGFLIAYREFYKTGTTVEERCHAIIEASGNQKYRSEGMWRERQTGEEYIMTILDYHEFRTDEVTGDGLDFEYIRSGLEVTSSTTFRQEARRDVMQRWLHVIPAEKHFVHRDKQGKPIMGAPRIYIFDSCPNLIWEANKKCFRSEKSDRQGVSEKKIQNRDDHLMDCCEYVGCELAWMVEGRGVL